MFKAKITADNAREMKRLAEERMEGMGRITTGALAELVINLCNVLGVDFVDVPFLEDYKSRIDPEANMTAKGVYTLTELLIDLLQEAEAHRENHPEDFEDEEMNPLELMHLSPSEHLQ